MHETAFSPANILLPQDCGLTKWAVVACDNTPPSRNTGSE